MTTTTIADHRLKIAKAKRRAAEWMPFLQSFFQPMRCSPSQSVPTAGVDQYGRMYYNVEFINKLSVDVLAYIILHECLHCVLSHCKRTKRMEPNLTPHKAWLANIAQDLCIQQALLKQIGNHEPDNIIRIQEWTHIPGITPGRTSEQYYEALLKWTKEKDEEREKEKGRTPGDSESDEESDDESMEDCDETDRDGDDSETTDDAEDGDSEQDGGDSESDGDQRGGSGDEGESDSESDGDSESGGSGSGSPSESEAGSSGTPDVPENYQFPTSGEVLNPADAGSNSDGVEKEWEEDPTVSDIANVEHKLRQVEEELDELAPHKGSGAGQIRQALKARLRPLPDPFDQLKHVVSRAIAAPQGVPQLTYQKWPRRSLPGKARLRGVQRLQPEATILLDTSGSMESCSVKDKALAIVAKGVSRLQNPRVVCCDGAVQSAKRVSNMSRFSWDGGGGTDMVQGLIYTDKTYKPDTIVIITDGITDWPKTPTKAKVICALCRPEWASRVPKWITTVHLYKQGETYVL
jgi:predicted metal-dependent peptidase